MKKFGKWMTIGFVVQAIITGVRLGKGKTQKAWSTVTKEDMQSPWFWVGAIPTLIIGSIINIVLWPLSIFVEIYNTKKGW